MAIWGARLTTRATDRAAGCANPSPESLCGGWVGEVEDHGAAQQQTRTFAEVGNMKNRPTLETKRLILRPFDVSDATSVRLLAGDPAIADVTLGIAHPYEDGMAEDWISTHEDLYQSGKKAQFAIQSKSTEQLIGCISLVDIEEGHQAGLGYWIGRPYWGRGYCTEAGQAVLGYAFRERALLRVHSHHLSRNPASGRVMQKLGMKFEGRRRNHIRKSGRLEDIEMYGILKEEWQAANQPLQGTP